MATINLPANGQTLTDIPDYIASDDQLLRDLLSPTMPDLASATFERKTVGDLLTVVVSKKAGTKGYREMATIIEQFAAAAPYENPAYRIACEIAAMQERGAAWAEVKAISKQIDTALSAGRNEDNAISKAVAVLEESEAVALQTVPVGF